MSSGVGEIEKKRLSLQKVLDAEKTLLDRNQSGQFATPPSLAAEIIRFALGLHEGKKIDFLEPSCGSGSFFSALLQNIDQKELNSAIGVELDPRFADAASHLWNDFGLKVIQGDFTSPQTVASSASLLVANPPYVRHHHLEAAQKVSFCARCAEQVSIKPSGLSGLYLYFVLLSHRLLAPGAISAWLIPSEFMDVNYGTALKKYLSSKVELVRIHQYDASEVQFDDALVTSSVVVFRNNPPTEEHVAEFTFGGTLSKPKVVHRIERGALNHEVKWSRYIQGVESSDSTGEPKLSDFFRIRRGLATGSNTFFILPRKEAEARGIKREFLRPILPSPRNLKQNIVASDDAGWPELPDQLALIDCPLPIEQIRDANPALASYLDDADDSITSGYLVSKRKPWYKQEHRKTAPFLLTYMGRGRDDEHPLRFIRNESEAVATNMYLMLYPTPPMERFLESTPSAIQQVHKALLELTAEELRGGGRVYGGGLHKMEPKELAALPASTIAALDPDLAEACRLAPTSPSKASRAPGRSSRRSRAECPATSDVRSWARSNGMEVSVRGRLSPEVWAAWHAAHPDSREPVKEDPSVQTLW